MATSFDRGGRPDNSSAGFLAPVPPDARPTGLTYEPFYGLREKPFSLTSDSRFFYQSRSHAPAFDDLLNAIRRRESLNILTGDIGTGKTTLCRTVLQSLDRKTFSAFVPDPFASREELLKVLLTDFGVASVDDVTSGRLRQATRTELSYLLSEFLATLAPLQAFAVAIIDEAQNLSQQLLEEVRILSDADGQLQVILVGQLELRDRLRQPDMRQLDQRVSVHCRLQPLDLAGVAGYISHRLHVAGGSSDRVRFTGEAVEAIYLLSGGIPRIINRVCDRALRYGYSKREAEIDVDIVESASAESGRETSRASASIVVPPLAAMPGVPVPPAAPGAAARRCSRAAAAAGCRPRTASRGRSCTSRRRRRPRLRPGLRRRTDAPDRAAAGFGRAADRSGAAAGCLARAGRSRRHAERTCRRSWSAAAAVRRRRPAAVVRPRKLARADRTRADAASGAA